MMKRRLSLAIMAFLITISLLSALPQVIAQEKEKEKEKEKKKKVILSTVDIDEDYEILGLVYYRSNELSPKRIHDELQKQAEELGADYVIGITYYSNSGYLYGTGTAVRLIKSDR